MKSIKLSKTKELSKLDDLSTVEKDECLIRNEYWQKHLKKKSEKDLIKLLKLNDGSGKKHDSD